MGQEPQQHVHRTGSPHHPCGTGEPGHSRTRTEQQGPCGRKTLPASQGYQTLLPQASLKPPLARPPAAAARCGGGSLSRETRRSKGGAAKSPAWASLPLSTHQEAFPQQLRCGSRTPGRSQPSAAPSSHGPAPLPDSGFLPHRSELPFPPCQRTRARTDRPTQATHTQQIKGLCTPTLTIPRRMKAISEDSVPGACAARILPYPFSLQADLCRRETGLRRTPRTLLKGDQGNDTRGHQPAFTPPRQSCLTLSTSLQVLPPPCSFLGSSSLKPRGEHSVELASMSGLRVCVALGNSLNLSEPQIPH